MLRAGGMRAPALPIRGCACGGPQPEQKKRKGPGRPRKVRPACEVCGGTGVLPWHHLTRATWATWWASPMASAWIEADLPGLQRAIQLVEDFHRAETARERRELQSEIRQQELRFGLSPIDRRRLEWSLDKPEDEPEAAPVLPQPTGTDARALLRVVK